MSRRTLSSWRVPDAPAVRPQFVLLAAVVLAVLLIEVWQTSTVASLSMRLGRSTELLQQANAERAWTNSRLDQSSSRSQLGPVAGALGLKPVDPHRIVTLPEEYLEPAPGRPASAPTTPLLALAGRALEAIVPEAAARGRGVN
ncbi:MAG: hypothetical protein IT347_13620 [Candidatus Eisenbacteria bacterium]|nr:hypothetical protein [Candidatus Eisenbacteria bacterium]